MGVFPSTLKSKALCVYFQMYSPLRMILLPIPCWKPAWNSLRNPGCRIPETPLVQFSSGARNDFVHPSLDSTRFSLNGVSRVRAYEMRKTVEEGFTLYAIPMRGCVWLASVRPL